MPIQLHEKLARFAEKGDETCFAQVVEEFSGLVFNGALRRTCDRQVAEEVTQNVFAIAARKSRSLSRHPQLTAWFHTTTRFEASKAMQSRHRYQKRIDQFADEMNAPSNPLSPEEQQDGIEALPHLDESLDRLSPTDREIIYGRFFEERSFKEIAERSGSSEAACKMRLKRSLGKLNRWLTGRGVTLSTTALATLLTAEFSKAAPVVVSAALPSSAIAASSGVTYAAILTNSLNTMSTIKSASIAAAAVLLLGGIPFAIQQSEARELREKVASLEDDQNWVPVHRGRESRSPENELEQTPVRQFLKALNQEKHMGADAFITQMTAVLLTQDMTQMMRVLLPLAKLSNEEAQALLDDVQASDKPAQMKQVAVQMLSMMIGESDDDPSSSLERSLANGIEPRNMTPTLSKWAATDPEAAIAWFMKNRSDGNLAGKGVNDYPEMHLLTGLVMGVAESESDPDRAITLLEGYEGSIRNLAVSQLVSVLAHRGGEKKEKALALLSGLKLQDEKILALQSTIPTLIHKGKTDVALEFIKAAALDDGATAMAISMAATARGRETSAGWAEQVSWAMEQVPESARDELIDNLANSGVRTNPSEVSAWVDALPAGEERDTGLKAEAFGLTQSNDIEGAMSRAAEIGDAKLRAEAVESALVWLHHSNPAAAAKVAQDHGYDIGEIIKN